MNSAATSAKAIALREKLRTMPRPVSKTRCCPPTSKIVQAAFRSGSGRGPPVPSVMTFTRESPSGSHDDPALVGQSATTALRRESQVARSAGGGARTLPAPRDEPAYLRVNPAELPPTCSARVEVASRPAERLQPLGPGRVR